MSNPTHHGPRPLSDILGELFTVRGYNRLYARRELENAWHKALGEPQCHQTQLGEVRRGILSVTVAHPTLLEELAAFRKSSLLKALRSNAPATIIHDIRFRVGLVVEASSSPGVDSILEVDTRKHSQVSGQSRYAEPSAKREPRQTSESGPVGS